MIETIAEIPAAHTPGRAPAETVRGDHHRIAAHGDPAIFITFGPAAEAIVAAEAPARQGQKFGRSRKSLFKRQNRHNHRMLRPRPSRVNSRRVVVSLLVARRDAALCDDAMNADDPAKPRMILYRYELSGTRSCGRSQAPLYNHHRPLGAFGGLTPEAYPANQPDKRPSHSHMALNPDNLLTFVAGRFNRLHGGFVSGNASIAFFYRFSALGRRSLINLNPHSV